MATVDYFQRKLDDKRRLTIPAELRHEFAGGVVVTRGFQKYLHLYPRAVWDDEVEPLLKGNILDEHTADLNVQFRMGKSDGDIDDKQGRITIEQHLLDYAGIDKEIVAVRVWKVLAAHEQLMPDARQRAEDVHFNNQGTNSQLEISYSAVSKWP